MKSEKILYTSADVRKTIIDIFSKSRGRRVAITAFVGGGAETYLPKPAGIELVCWPQAGGTNPDAVRKLMKIGVKVVFADALHMKIYWTEDQGAVITSANLSTNALGAGGLLELGVLLHSTSIDIEKILRSIKQREVSSKELDRLEREHYIYHSRNNITIGRSRTVDFLEWYSLPNRKTWRIGYHTKTGDFSSASKEIAKAEYGIKDPNTFISCAAKTFRQADRVLTFYLGKKSISDLEWLSVDYIVPTSKTDKEYEPDYPFQALQIWPEKRYPPPPFKVDKKFCNAFAAAIKAIGFDKIRLDDPHKPTKRLIELIRENY
jgi:hypothetical protein